LVGAADLEATDLTTVVGLVAGRAAALAATTFVDFVAWGLAVAPALVAAGAEEAFFPAGAAGFLAGAAGLVGLTDEDLLAIP
jgi:hypothetical protein